METKFRLFDFNFYNETELFAEGYEEDTINLKMKFLIQMFAVDEKGKTCSIIVDNFKPFFYVLISDNWNIQTKEEFITHLKKKLGRYHSNELTGCIIVKRKKLYGFDGRKEHKFIRIEFSNMNTFNKTKNFWYSEYNEGKSHLLPNGYVFNSTKTRLYEANIPPILRYFHMQDISPSGWVVLLNVKNTKHIDLNKKTTCDFEYTMSYMDIISISDKETRVPYKICSFDIEASSSHGDFPVPIKSYKKLATNIVEYFENLTAKMTPELCKNILRRIMLCAFGFYTMKEIDIVYPKKSPKSKADVETMTEQWVNTQIDHLKNRDFKQLTIIETMFELMKSGNGDDGDDDDDECGKTYIKSHENKSFTVLDILCDAGFDRESKLYEINKSLNHIFPRLEGDKVTFIGTTFMNYGDTETNLNHCIVLNTCSPIPIENSVIESYATEREVLLAWRNMIQRENPDIVIGYNIFGFDYDFMFRRAQENDCVEEFLKLSRNKEEVCGTKDPETGLYKIEESSIHIASGQHDLKFIKMNGRLQIDLYNFFRREETLSSYKLDSVAGHFIGDFVKELRIIESTSQIKTFNMTGLTIGSFIHFEEIGNSVDYYDGGTKFKVISINKKEGTFDIDTHINPDMSKKVRWCLAKDDVTPKDIFRMTNGTDDDRSVIAKYCIQDCNLVHYLMNKVDILTGFIEMSKICSVPINFLVMRGQGIKLTSFIAKKCREKRTLMPVMDKGSLEEGYEGAIVLEPKCDLYLDNPVACVDYASLYPSSMISENLSHDSKVWTKEYDLAGNLVGETGEKRNGVFIYDNLPDYKYVDVEYDTYTYVRKTPSSAALKVKCGRKICRFAQFPDGMAIMPSILEELLSARKKTRKLIPQEPDEFMKNVLDKRQIGYKLTANSLYGQCGAKTSTFYEKDVAAATTSTGRLLLTYAKKMIEETYGDTVCETKNHGSVLSKAEYIYGDTDSVFFTFNLQTLDGEPIRGKKALEITIELAQEVGHLASSFLKKPHDLEYEKTFMPFCLLSKKRYVGILYEKDVNKCKRKEMGIVLKRRDNAPIVKDVYGGAIDILMIKKDLQEAIDFLKNCLSNLVNENYSMDKLIITKSLRSGYKKPKSIAHKVLADRIAIRDPGNKPNSGDRIPFVYINNPNKKALQGDRIETPTFIRENNLKIDYSFYITNQIMKPVQQLFALVLEKIWIMQNKKPQIVKFKQEVEILRGNCSNETFNDKLNDLKNKKIKILLFDEYLRETNNEKSGNQSLMKFYSKK